MKRNEILLSSLNKSGKGIEIGPFHRPIAPKKSGFDVEIIDHLTKEQLLEKHASQNFNFDVVEDVDHIWKGESYASLTGNEKHYDWIIASHVIEHTPDLIGFLKECDSILRDDGVVSLAVPDKRYCFDFFRPLTGLARVIDSHLAQRSINTPGTVAEFILNVVKREGTGAWSAERKGDFKSIHTLEEAKKAMSRVQNHEVHMDVHAWCFVPHSFRLLINDLYDLDLIPFKEVSFTSTVGSEFYITLGRQGKGLDMSRLEAAKRASLECAAEEALLDEAKVVAA